MTTQSLFALIGCAMLAGMVPTVFWLVVLGIAGGRHGDGTQTRETPTHDRLTFIAELNKAVGVTP